MVNPNEPLAREISHSNDAIPIPIPIETPDTKASRAVTRVTVHRKSRFPQSRITLPTRSRFTFRRFLASGFVSARRVCVA